MTSITEPIAERRLTGQSGPVTVTIGKPYPDREDWTCPFQVEGSAVNYAHGVDGLQALLNAIEGARATLDGAGLDLSWTGEEGHHGIPRSVPLFYGRAFAEDIERYIDGRIHAFGESARQRRRGHGSEDGDDR